MLIRESHCSRASDVQALKGWRPQWGPQDAAAAKTYFPTRGNEKQLWSFGHRRIGGEPLPVATMWNIHA